MSHLIRIGTVKNLTAEKLQEILINSFPPETRAHIRLCLWATEVLRRKCPVYWL